MKNNDKKDKNLHSGHRSRLKKKLINDFQETIEDHELFEILLFYSISRRNTNEIAHEILEKFGSPAEALNAPANELKQVFYVKDSSTALLKAVDEMKKRCDGIENKYDFVSSYDSCCSSVLKLMSHGAKEGTYIVWINKKGGLLLATPLKKSIERFEESLFFCKNIYGVGIGGAIIVSFSKDEPLIPSSIVLEKKKAFQEKMWLHSVPLLEYFLYNGKSLVGLLGERKFETLLRGAPQINKNISERG